MLLASRCRKPGSRSCTSARRAGPRACGSRRPHWPAALTRSDCRGLLRQQQPGSERILLDLEEANAFVISLDPARTWFRYHHLFADLLRLELRRRLPEQLPALHRLAAGWLSGHGEIIDAIRHTQAAGDWSGAARLLADHSFGLTLDGQAQTIQTLLLAFPPGAVAAGPDLPLAHAASELARGRLDEAAAHLAVAETSIAATAPSRQHRLEVATAALRLPLARKRGHLAGWSIRSGSLPRR